MQCNWSVAEEGGDNRPDTEDPNNWSEVFQAKMKPISLETAHKMKREMRQFVVFTGSPDCSNCQKAVLHQLDHLLASFPGGIYYVDANVMGDNGFPLGDDTFGFADEDRMGADQKPILTAVEGGKVVRKVNFCATNSEESSFDKEMNRVFNEIKLWKEGTFYP